MIARASALGLVLMAVVASPASAAPPSFKNFGVQCATGAFTACVSVQAWNEFDPSTGEYYLYVRFVNVQGRPKFADLVRSGLQGWQLHNLELHNCTPLVDFNCDDGFEPNSNIQFRMENHSTSVDGPFAELELNLLERTGSSIGVNSELWGGGERMLYGCDIPGAGDPELIYSIPIGGCNVALTARLTLGNGAGFALTDSTSLSLSFGRFLGTSDAHVGCSTEPGQSGLPASLCTQVVPEPATVLLLGTGLAGLGVGLLRRRKRTRDL